ncbi:hypothetical protein KJ841_03060 [Patescibacteria group bacterium]|nr:hypothetical protein [Patescibacteria group bacterium]
MNNIFSIIISPTFLFYLKIAFIVIGALFLLGIIFLLLKNSWLKRRFLEDWTEFFIYRPFGVKKTFKQWAKVLKRLETGKEADYKLAVIEADGLLNDILKKMGYKGETMAKILEQLDSTVLPDIEQIWEVHKIRNKVVHDPDYELNLEQARKILGIYEKSFRTLEMF